MATKEEVAQYFTMVLTAFLAALLLLALSTPADAQTRPDTKKGPTPYERVVARRAKPTIKKQVISRTTFWREAGKPTVVIKETVIEEVKREKSR